MAAITSVGVFLVPIVASILTAMLVATILPSPKGTPWLVAWWAVMLVVPTSVLVLCQRLARRLVPLTTLLKMTLLFPDRAPTRMSVARKAGSTHGLERRLNEARASGLVDEPSVAAEHILALATALNGHDRLTRGHSERVRVLTDLIADELKLLTADRDRLRWAALLHDIGKLGVDPEVLNKPGKPDAEEWELLKSHPAKGALLSQPLAAWLGQWHKTIIEHHERYDGLGYPFGLAGLDISYGGRIVAVADSYETMTAVRSYKRAMSPQAARAELAACAGTQFDPNVVRAFLGTTARRYGFLSGPLSWLGQQPFVNGVPRVAQLSVAVARTAVGVAAVVGIAAVAHAHPAALPKAAVELTIARPSTPTSTRASTVPLAAPTSVGPSPFGVPTPAPAQTAPSSVSASTTTAPVSAPTASVPAPLPPTTVPPTTVPPTTVPPTTVPPTTVPATTVPPTTVPTTVPVTVPTNTAPGPATAVGAVAGNGQVMLTWSPPASDGGSTIVTYTVTPYIGGVAQPPQVFSSASTSQVVTGLANGTSYTFTVTATNAVGSGLPSAPSPAMIPAGVPGAPTGVVGVSGDRQVLLSWTAPSANGSAIQSYTVTPAIGGVAQTPVFFNSPATSETVVGLTNGTAYTFTVTATNAVGSGLPSAPSNSVTPAGLPGSPTGVVGVPGDAQVSLSWIAPASNGSAIVSYTVTPAIAGVAQTSQFFNSPATADTVTGLTNGTAYTFTVIATNAVGSGLPSAPSNSVTPAGRPGSPTAVVGVPGDTQVSLSWTAPANNGSPIVSYTVTPAVAGVAQTSQFFNSPATTDTVTGLTNGTAYTFTVTATNAVGSGLPSAPSTAVTPTGVPDAPAGLLAVPGDGQVMLSWTAPSANGSPILSYTVTPSIAGVAQTPRFFSSPASSETVIGLVNGTTYTFTVTAANALGSGPPSAPSNAATPAGLPGPPTALVATSGSGQVNLSWVAPSANGSPVASYTVTPFIGLAAQTPQFFNSPATSEAVVGLANGTAYTFTVSAANSVGSGPPSAPSSSVTPAGVPGAPTALVAVAGDGQVGLSWTAPGANGSPIASYTVTPFIGATAQTPQVFPSSATTEVVTGLTNGTAYTFTVTATNGVGSGPASAPSSPPVVPTAPGGGSLTIVNGSTGNDGQAEQSDQIIVRYSSPIDPSLFCSSWSVASHPDIATLSVQVTGHNGGVGNDTIASVSDLLDCGLGGFHFGTIDLGQNGYFGTDRIFGNPAKPSAIHWDGLNTLTITLGHAGGTPTQKAPSVAVYTPDAALGVAGTISSANTEHF